MSMVIDPKVFEAAGVELPDDETWTWDDYADIAAEIARKSPQGTFGTNAHGQRFLPCRLGPPER